MDLGKLNISVEDRFVILQLNVENNLLPNSHTLDRLAYILSSLSPNYQVICDFRNVKMITNDLIYFIEEFEFYNSQVLLDEKHLSFFKEHVNQDIKLLPVTRYETKFEEHEINLAVFASGSEVDFYYHEYKEVFNNLESAFSGLPTEDEYNTFLELEGYDFDSKPYFKDYTDYLYWCKKSKVGIALGSEIILGRRYLIDKAKQIGKTSLLSQLCLFPNKDGSFNIDTYQTNTFNKIEVKNDVVRAKPYIISNITQNLFYNELLEFQNIISNKNIKENQIQKFLEKHPIFLKFLGYKNVRPQVILERDDGTFLKPDFLLEPIGEEWWDILDIKLPSRKIINSTKRDRYKFSESINELQAQLREYAAYFENEKYAKRIEDKYGIKCYKPKLIGVIGDDIEDKDERQSRRLMTSYSDLKIVPFNQLYNICKERILI